MAIPFLSIVYVKNSTIQYFQVNLLSWSAHEEIKRYSAEEMREISSLD